jgi:DNA-binding SARP family transcriptional activator/WD40 repeat protein
MEFLVLGPIAARVDGREVPIGGPRQRRLLAALVRDEGRVVSAGQLADAVWGDEANPPPAAERTLQSYVSRLRTALSDGQVIGEAGGYRLELCNGAVDAHRFSALVADAASAPPETALGLLDEGLALWRGPAYAEFAHEDWVRPVAAGLEELRLVALERRAQARLDLGQHTEVVPEMEVLAREHPLRERFQAQLMLALHRSGRQGDALRSFRRHRATLAEETGLVPSRELVDLERRIALDDPSLAFVAAGRVARGYILADEIGEGSFGTVYRAIQPSVGREVAVKVVRAEFADDPEYVRRFETEARLVARLEHPHVVPLYDFWREPGGAFLVFRYVRGGTAVSRHAGAWPLDEVDKLATEVGAALGIAHAAGVTHRDVKPANVLFDESGNSYLADFGIATHGPDLNAVGTLRSAGSPLYASPEQARDGVATAASDQYALGVMIWELLAGRAPFQGDNVSELFRHKFEQPVPPLRDYRPDVPTPIGDVLQRATSVHPSDRYPTVADFVLAWTDAIRRTDWAAATSDAADLGDGLSASMATLTKLGLGEINPYKGLRPFDEADAASFFGREDDTDALTALVAGHAFSAVVGPSGSGKSSLVRAGLIPRLRDQGSLVVVVVPGADPVAQLVEALREVTIGDHPRRTVEEALAAAVPAQGELVVVLDQFEELWTLADEDARTEVLAALTTLTGVRVVVTIRADFFDRPLADAMIGPSVREATFALTPLTPVDLERAITAPAAKVGVRLEPGLVAELVADVSAQPASLPLLQYALTELYDHRDGATMTVAAYEAMGRIAGAMTARAETVCAAGAAEHSRRLFTRLVTPGEGVEDTRHRARMTELSAVPASVIDAYGAARLLTFDVDPATREPTVEVAHEALLRHWPRLRAWLDEDRDGLRLHRHLSDAALAWEAGGRPAADLYRGARLESADVWSRAHADSLTPLEHAYVHEARRRARRGRRLARGAVTAISVLLVVAVVAALLAFVQQRRADDNAAAARSERDRAEDLLQETETRRLVAESGNAQSKDLALSLLLAREANARADDTSTRSALQSALLSNEPILGYLQSGPTAEYGAAALGAGGRRLYVARTDANVIEVWDPQASRQIDEIAITAAGGIESLVASPSRRRVAAVLSESGITTVIDTESGEIVTTIELPRSRSADLQSSPAFLDDEHLLSFRDHELLSYDLASDQIETRYTATDPILLAAVQGSHVFLGLPAPGGGFRVAVVDATSWSTITELPVPLRGNLIWQIAPSVDGRQLAVAVPSSASQEAVILDIATGLPVGPYWPEQSAMPAALPDGGFLVGSSAGELRRRSATGEQLGPAVDLFNGPTAPGGISVDGDTAYVIGRRGVATVSIPLIDGAVGRSKLGRPLSGMDGGPAFGAGGIVALQRRSDGNVLVADLDSAEDPTVLEPTGATPLGGLPGLIAVSADGRLIAAAGLSGVLSVFDAATRRLVHSIPYATDRPIDSDLTGGAGTAAGGYATVWWVSATTAILGTFDSVVSIDLETGQKRWEARGFRRLVTSVSVSTDETLAIASDFDGTTRLLRFDDGAEVGAPLANGSMTATERGTEPVVRANAALFRPDSHVAALADWDTGAVRFVDVDTHTETDPPLMVVAGLAGFNFSSDGRTLAVSGSQGAVRLFDLGTSAQIGDPFPSTTSFTSGNFTADGRAMIVGGYPPIVYDVDPASWREKACTVAGRNLTKVEWEQYMPPDEPYRATCPEHRVES